MLLAPRQVHVDKLLLPELPVRIDNVVIVCFV